MTKILIDEATVKQVLEALEYIHEGANNQGPHTGISWRCVSNKAEPAITALKALVEQPAQQSCYCLNCEELSKQVTALKTCLEVERGFHVQEQPAHQEPVAWISENAGLYHGKPDESLNPLPLYLSLSEGDIRALKHRIHELEGELMGYKKIVADQDALLERQTARIVDLQTHIENLEGEDR